MLYITCWIGPILRFGGGCPCHTQELLRGQKITCPKKGRCLPYVYDFAKRALDEGLEEANQWHPLAWGSPERTAECVAAVRSVHGEVRPQMGSGSVPVFVKWCTVLEHVFQSSSV